MELNEYVVTKQLHKYCLLYSCLSNVEICRHFIYYIISLEDSRRSHSSAYKNVLCWLNFFIREKQTLWMLLFTFFLSALEIQYSVTVHHQASSALNLFKVVNRYYSTIWLHQGKHMV